MWYWLLTESRHRTGLFSLSNTKIKIKINSTPQTFHFRPHTGRENLRICERKKKTADDSNAIWCHLSTFSRKGGQFLLPQPWVSGLVNHVPIFAWVDVFNDVGWTQQKVIVRLGRWGWVILDCVSHFFFC